MARARAEERAVEDATGRSVVDEVTDRIAFDIAAGRYAPGDRLPSVRALARLHDINPSTVQVVVARLRAAGFVEASPGLGLRVRDIEATGGLDTWRYLFRFAQRLPDRAIRLFEGFLRTRRALVLEVARTLARDPAAYDLAPVRRALERFALAADGGATPEELARAELAAARVLLRQADEPALLALYNSVTDVLLGVPAVLEAMYAEPRFNLTMWRALLDAWESGGVDEEGLARGEKALATFHVTCVERFASSLARG